MMMMVVLFNILRLPMFFCCVKRYKVQALKWASKERYVVLAFVQVGL